MTNEQTNLDQTGAWEPDYDYLMQAGASFPWRDERHRLRAVIAEYRRQQATQGVVEVRLELLQRLDDIIYRFYLEADEVFGWQDDFAELDAILAAAAEQDR